MPVDGVAATPAGRRIQLGALLRQLRRRSGLTQDEVGSRVWPDMSPATAQNKITRLEGGDGGIRPEDLKTLLAVYDVFDAAKIRVLHDLNTRTSQRGRLRGSRATHAGNVRKFVDLAGDAVAIREAAWEAVPSLLQCEAYLRALRDGPVTASHARAVEAEVAAQREQQDLVLRKNSAQVYVMLSESCVRRVRGSSAVMREQIDHLIALSLRPNIRIHLIPFTTTVQGTDLFERFTVLRLACPQILDGFTEYVDLAFGRLGGEPVYAPARIEAFQRLWLQAANAALDPAKTRRHLRDIDRDLR